MPCGPRSTSTRDQVEEVDVGREERQRDHRFVEVDADLLLDARLVAHDLAGGDAAHGDLALAGAEVLDGEAGDVRGDVFDRFGAEVAQLLFGRRGDRDRHVLHGLLALTRGDDHFLVRASAALRRSSAGGGGVCVSCGKAGMAMARMRTHSTVLVTGLFMTHLRFDGSAYRFGLCAILLPRLRRTVKLACGRGATTRRTPTRAAPPERRSAARRRATAAAGEQRHQAAADDAADVAQRRERARGDAGLGRRGSRSSAAACDGLRGDADAGAHQRPATGSSDGSPRRRTAPHRRWRRSRR